MDLDWSVLLRWPYSSDLAPSGFYLFPFLQNALKDKNIFSRRGENIWERLTQNQLNLIWEEPSSYLMNSKRWFKIIVNILLIEINSLLNHSWINYISHKMEIIYNSSQYIETNLQKDIAFLKQKHSCLNT